MDAAYRDSSEARLKEREAKQLRKEEAYNRGNPRITRDLEDAARALDTEASGLREKAEEDAAAERAPLDNTE